MKRYLSISIAALMLVLQACSDTDVLQELESQVLTNQQVQHQEQTEQDQLPQEFNTESSVPAGEPELKGHETEKDVMPGVIVCGFPILDTSNSPSAVKTDDNAVDIHSIEGLDDRYADAAPVATSLDYHLIDVVDDRSEEARPGYLPEEVSKPDGGAP